MKTSETITKLAPALLAAQKKIGSAVKGSKNPFFKSTYADLGSVMETCKEELNEQGITVLQPVGTDELGVYVETVLLHESGEFISDKMRLAIKDETNPQTQGSAITYARRYSLQSMVFIPAEDDDAERATDHSSTGNVAGHSAQAELISDKFPPKTKQAFWAISYKLTTTEEADKLLALLEKAGLPDGDYAALRRTIADKRSSLASKGLQTQVGKTQEAFDDINF